MNLTFSIFLLLGDKSTVNEFDRLAAEVCPTTDYWSAHGGYCRGNNEAKLHNMEGAGRLILVVWLFLSNEIQLL